MTEMVERVAKIMHEKLCEQDISGYLNSNYDLHAVARAAIEAMREPTKAMVEGVYSSIKTNAAETVDYDEIYTVMIDAALKEE